MADYGDKPFGINDIKLTDITGTTQVDLPNERKLSFGEEVVTDSMRGGGKTVAVVTELTHVNASLEAGGISLEAFALMTGRTATETGTTPTLVNTLTGSGAERYPYFKIYGKSLGDGDDDIHVKLYKCKLTAGLEGEFADGGFFLTGIGSIVCIDDGVNGIYDLVQNETADDLPAT